MIYLVIEENEIEKKSCSLKATSPFPASSVSTEESLVIQKSLLQYELDNILAEQSETSSISRPSLIVAVIFKVSQLISKWVKATGTK
jgi:hypothetical protein